jgi:diguanylate cyclase (GGDEF)-like protein/PAS domain S-box-containing protein
MANDGQDGGSARADNASAGREPSPGIRGLPERELFTWLVESSDDAILTQTRDGTITSWNRGAERLYGYSAEEAIGSPIAIIVPRHLAARQREVLHRVFSGESVDHVEVERHRKDGSRIFVSLSVSGVRDANGEIISAAVIARDTTAQRRYEERLRHLADHDQLTGLFNRRRFDEELKREFARSGRHGYAGAVLSIDLDNFKAVNDTAGHSAGDAVLVYAANAMHNRLRASDIVARIGGDEFAVLLANVDEADARTAAEDILRTLRASRPVFGGKRLRVRASVGVATFHSDDATADELRVFADLAMYAAKNAGGDRVTVYSPDEGRRARSLVRQPWSERIREALDLDRFALYLQPILNLSTGKISHGELLLRMRDERGRLIQPSSFLPAAERVGLINEIDRWVVRAAIELLAAGQDPTAAGGVGVNLSGASVTRNQHLLEVIDEQLKRTGVDPRRLIFEVTETTAIANMPDAATFAEDLTRLGCSLALDDFGMGFSSFYYLKHLPVRYIKLDGEFIQNLPRSKVDEHVVRAIVDVAKSMGIKTVAESVADDATIKLLRKHHVDYAQGFHIGKPARVRGRGGRAGSKPAAGASASSSGGKTRTTRARRRVPTRRRPS